MEKEFNQNEYIKAYNKSHYKRFGVYLKEDEMNELDDLLKKHKLSKAEFLRQAIDKLKED